jgi:GT2 family glycosyltransferase
MIGVVVVCWNSGAEIGACLDACLADGDLNVVVVDNASSDNSCEEVRKRPAVRLIANTSNRGFAAACNQGISMIAEPAVLLLNPDAVPVRGVRELAGCALEPGVGACGGQLIGEDARPQEGFNVRSFPTPLTLAFEVTGLNRVAPGNPVNRRYRARFAEGDVDQPAGAFLMINRAAWEVVGGLDEGFWPAWFEDVDFCRRLRESGYRVRFFRGAVARHLGGHSANRLDWEQRQLFWYGNLLRYSGKHFSTPGVRLVAAAVMLACLPRAIAALASGRRSGPSVYSKVFLLAWNCWRKGGCLS